MDGIQEEITENGRLLRPFQSSGRSLRMVDHFQNLMNLKVGNFSSLFQVSSFFSFADMRLTKDI